MDNKYEMCENYETIIKPVDLISQEILSSPNNNRRENFFPLLIDRLDLKTGVEVGVDKGQFSKHLLSNSNLSVLYGVDSWMDDFGSNHRPGFFDPIGQNRMNDAAKNLQEFGNRSVLIKATSMEAANNFEDGSLDFCYIDGDHSLEMLFDLYTWVNKIRIGGVLAFDDVKDGPNGGVKDYFGEQLPFRIKTCLDFFCNKFGFKLNIFGRRNYDAWFVKNR